MYSFFFNNHRKLLNDSGDDTIIKLCEPYCDQIDNQDGACPYQCLTRCYPICNHPILFDPPPPPPPPPVFISYDDYHQASSKSHKLSLFFTLSLAILAATFLLFAIYTAYKFYKGRYFPWRNRSPPPPPPVNQPQDEVPMVREYFLDQDIGSMVDHPIWYIRTVGLQPSIINSISTFKYSKSDGLVEGTECSVCLNEFQEDEILRLLPKCQHAFHISCIDTWLRSHINCPLCRALIVIPTSNSISQSTTLSNIVESQIVENRVSDTEAETHENPELSIRVDNDNDIESRVEDVTSSNVHLIRRSVSMDSLAASDISAAIKGIDSSEKVCSSSNETLSLSKGPSIMVKRSLSCSAKVFLSRYSKGRSSAAAAALPPPPPAEAAAL